MLKAGDRVKIKESVKGELLLKYGDSKGVCGVSPKEIDNLFVVSHFIGIHVAVSRPDGTKMIFNPERFERVGK